MTWLTIDDASCEVFIKIISHKRYIANNVNISTNITPSLSHGIDCPLNRSYHECLTISHQTEFNFD